MKKNRNFKIKFLPFLLAVLLITACEKDEEKNKDYYGGWESNAYDSYSTQGIAIKEKMAFTFTNNTFEDEVYQGLTADALTLAVGIKGDIENPEVGKMDAEINEISIQGGPYTDKQTDPTSFYTKFDGSIGMMLYEEFSLEYTIDVDTMILELPVKNPAGGDDIMETLRLYRQ